MLELVPISQREAFAFIELNHRHHTPPRGAILHVAVADSEKDDSQLWQPKSHDYADSVGAVVGVAIAGRPVARMLDDGWTLECTRCCTDGTRNAPSMLYGALWRAARALGWRRMVTYTLPQESGESLRGAGFTLIGEAGGGSWNRPSRPRVDTHPTQAKLRWERTIPAAADADSD